MRFWVFNSWLVLCVVYPIGALWCWYSGLPNGRAILGFSVVPLLFLGARLYRSRSFVDVLLRHHAPELGRYKVAIEEFAGYRHLDLHRAIRWLGTSNKLLAEIDSKHDVPLSDVLAVRFMDEAGRSRKPAEHVSCEASLGEHVLVPTDSFHIILAGEGPPVVVRLRVGYRRESILEVAAITIEQAEGVLRNIADRAEAHSVYRGGVLEVSYQHPALESFGDAGFFQDATIRFRPRDEVAEDDIILEPQSHDLVWRGVIDFAERREELVKKGLPKQRAVLFYGPPGTGKTHTCKHLAHRLADSTFIFVSGQELLRVKSIYKIAQSLEPAVIVLEDVDLVATQREQGVYNPVLGDFMDVLDGHQDAELLFILTTNAIDRVEQAIKNRPARISQCIHFGAPSAALRERYLRRLTEDYEVDEDVLVGAVQHTEGATQAFLRELVHRMVQMSSNGSDAVVLDRASLQRALNELTAGDVGVGMNIIGFQPRRAESTFR